MPPTCCCHDAADNSSNTIAPAVLTLLLPLIEAGRQAPAGEGAVQLEERALGPQAWGAQVNGRRRCSLLGIGCAAFCPRVGCKSRRGPARTCIAACRAVQASASAAYQ